MLARAHWPSQAPRLAIAAWQALAVSVLASLVAAGAALSIGFQHVRRDLGRLLDLCTDNLAHAYAPPAGAVTASLGVTAAAPMGVSTAWRAISVWRREASARRRQVATLDVVGRVDVLPGVVVLDHDTPLAFCVGGRRRRVVVTRALLDSLDQREVDAVLAHEAAHLGQRHHVALTLCRIAFETLAPAFPAFRQATPLVRLYAELSADDSARRRVGARALRSALIRVACHPPPSGTLAASAFDVDARVQRLSGGAPTLPRRRAALAGLVIAALALVPVSLAAAPAVAVASESICLIG